jgi:Holliday junction resolvasome RuvABC ATP-dependent DNA helicase subunit
VTGQGELFLGIIALATLVMALIQVGAIIAAMRFARRLQQMVTAIQEEARPLIARANSVAAEASKTAAIASAQAQKIDRLVTDLTRRVDETSIVVQQAVVTPARETLALLAGLKAGLAALRGLRDFRGRTGRVEEEDPLFIG